MVDFSDREEVFAEAVSARPMRPVKVTVIAVLGIILGVIYLLGCLTSIPGILVQTLAPDAFNVDTSNQDPQIQTQVEIQKRMAEVTRQYLPMLIGLTLASLLMGASLIYGSVQVLRNDRAASYRFLANVCLAGIVVTILSAIFTTILQLANWHAMDQTFLSVEVKGNIEMFRNIMQFSFIAGLVMGILYQLAQLLYFVLGRWVLAYQAANMTQED